MLVSFDVVSLYTKISVEEVLKVLKEITSKEITNMVAVCLNSTYFTFQGEMYEQTSGVVMGSLLSPVVDKLYMEYFEKKALESYPLKTREWKQFVDNTKFIWPHRREKLDDFLKHMNSQSNHIKFTMEIPKNNCLPFLDVLITKREDGCLSHQVYWKKTHTDT